MNLDDVSDDLGNIHHLNNETDVFGCCSIVLQLDGNDTIFAYRRDSNFTADVHIENVTWHGIPAIKQYKSEGGEFCHVIITNDGWVIGLGGIDDGIDNEKCENITAEMINENFTISKDALKEIQDIKKTYGRGHAIIKAPNGNYGFATVDKIKTGKMNPGEYKSLPNNYTLSRSGEIPLDSEDKIKAVCELAQSDKYGLDRREIIIYDFKTNQTENLTDIYVSNEDGSLINMSYEDCIDDVYFNNTLIKGEEIPIAPDYEKIGSVTFSDADNLIGSIVIVIIAVLTVIIVSIASYSFVKFIKFR